MHKRTETQQGPRSVMLVEDEPDTSAAITQVLEEAGYRVYRCADGREALSHLQAGSVPDVILLDLIMPEVNGWEFRVAQRQHPEWVNIPVIVLTGDCSAQGLAIDADRFLKKPMRPESLLESVGRLLLARDRARIDARSMELDRMSSLGVLSAGLAHEINNPLAVVIGNLELGLQKCEELSGSVEAPAERGEFRHLFEQAQAGATRIADIVRNVSLFARAATEQTVPIDVQRVLASSLQLVRNEIRHHARLELELASVPDVMGDPAKLGQVFINLLINAVQALDSANASRNIIRITTSVTADAQVVISIADSGCGIPPEIIGRVFDPFFSTREVGAGQALGLAVCRGLVSSMGGRIRVESTQGEGTTFFVTLPSHGSIKVVEPRPQGREPLHQEQPASLLVIDDEAMMCSLLRKMLRSQYQIETLTNARAALERLLSGEFFDVILCDLMMPELTGMDLYAQLALKCPEQAERIIFMSGGTFTQEAGEFLDRLAEPYLTKPFLKEQLSAALAQRLRKFAQTIPAKVTFH